MSMPKTGKVVLKSQEQLCGAGQFPQRDFMEEPVSKQLFATLNMSFSLTPITTWFHKAEMPSRDEHHLCLMSNPLTHLCLRHLFSKLFKFYGILQQGILHVFCNTNHVYTLLSNEWAMPINAAIGTTRMIQAALTLKRFKLLAQCSCTLLLLVCFWNWIKTNQLTVIQ